MLRPFKLLLRNKCSCFLSDRNTYNVEFRRWPVGGHPAPPESLRFRVFYGQKCNFPIRSLKYPPPPRTEEILPGEKRLNLTLNM